MNTLMMRCVVTVALLAAGSSRAEGLFLDESLLQDVESTLLRSAGLPDGFLLQDDTEPKKSGGGGSGGGGGGGGGRNLPPQLSGVGLGLQVGSPTALTIKFGGVQESGIVLGVGAGFGYNRFNTSLSVHVDYLFHVATLIRQSQVALTAYIGPGLWLSMFGDGFGFGVYRPYYFNSFIGVGVRMPLGLALGFSGAPIEVYLELDPALFVFPGIDFGVGASLGFRWHF